MSNPRTVFITGANRGIGFELVKQLLQYSNPPEIIFATYRKKEDAKNLFELAEKNNSVKPLLLEVRDHSAFPKIVKDVESIVGNKGLNLLINNAGIGEHNQALMEVTHEQMINAHEVNVISPLFLSRAAVNMFSKSLSIDLKPDQILVIALHPGHVKTDLGGARAPLSVEESVAHIVKTLSRLDINFNGGFVNYDGQILPY